MSRTAIGYVALWVGVVLVGSTVTWAVISRAGDTVVTSDDVPVRTSSTSAPRSSAPTISPSTTPESTAPTSTDSPSAPSVPATVQPVERTWSGAGGVVVVVCRGTAAELDDARPDSGYRAELDDLGPDRVEVEFEGTGDDGAKTRVRASCVDGEPVFEVDSD